jgi:hypothetical protein
MIIPAATKTTIRICIQSQKGDTGAQASLR